jgi:hypothetical protein
MRKRLTTLALTAVAAAAIVPVAAPPAHAWTCTMRPLPVDPDPGVIVCDVVMEVAGFLCWKVGGPCG